MRLVASWLTGKIESAPFIKTIADGLMTKLGDKTFPIIQENVQEVLTVTDEEIIQAMKLVYERMKIVIEPSAAVPLASVLKNNDIFRGKRTGIILSGGNVDTGKLSEWFSKV